MGVRGFCENGDEYLGSIRGLEFLEYLGGYEFLKKGCYFCYGKRFS
jgi:hypothetical protein